MSKIQTWGRQKGDTQGCHFTLGRLHSSWAEVLLTSQMGRQLGRGASHIPDGAAVGQRCLSLPRWGGGRVEALLTSQTVGNWTEALLTSQTGRWLGRGVPHFPDRNLPRLLGGRGRSTVTTGLYVGSCVPLLLPYVADVFCDFCSISLACLILLPLWLTALCTVSFLPQEQAYPFLPQDSLKL